MAKYSAEEMSSYESSGGVGFRIAKDNEKVRVVFLYSDASSIDGWAVHRFFGKKGFTYTVDCPRGPKDPLDKCPMCAAHEPLSTRLFVRMLNLNTNEITVWDRASSFRRDLVGFMEYFNPLYSRVYEITRRGTGLQTTYTYQSLGDSGITPEQYEEMVKKADEVAGTLVRDPDQYLTVKGYQEQAKNESEAESVQVTNNYSQGAWGAPPQGAWGGAPQNPGYSTPPTASYPAQPAQGWGTAPGAQTNPNIPSAPPAPANPTNSQPPQGWGAAPTGNWQQPPQGWGNNQ